MINDLLTQATCMVTVPKETGIIEIGTGWLASPEGHIITAAHVLSTDKTTVPTEVSVKFGNGEPMTAKQIAWHYHHDHGLDVAILKLDSLPAGLSPLPISLVTEVEGDCRLAGYGKPLMNRSSGMGKFSGIYDCKDNSAYRLFLIDSTALAAEGYSGGAIFSDKLQAVVAIQVEAARRGGAGLNTVLALPLYRVAEVWGELKELAKPMHMNTIKLDLITVRRQLTQQFDDPGFDSFCMDYFPQVFNKFGRGLRLDEKINLLLDYCRRTPARSQALLDALQNHDREL